MVQLNENWKCWTTERIMTSRNMYIAGMRLKLKVPDEHNGCYHTLWIRAYSFFMYFENNVNVYWNTGEFNGQSDMDYNYVEFAATVMQSCCYGIQTVYP